MHELGWIMWQISDHVNISLGCVYHICNNPTTPTKQVGQQPLLTTSIRKCLIDFVSQSAANWRMTFPEVAYNGGLTSQP